MRKSISSRDMKRKDVKFLVFLVCSVLSPIIFPVILLVWIGRILDEGGTNLVRKTDKMIEAIIWHYLKLRRKTNEHD